MQKGHHQLQQREDLQEVADTDIIAEGPVAPRRHFIDSVLIIEAPPSYREAADHPFSPAPLPSYESVTVLPAVSSELPSNNLIIENGAEPHDSAEPGFRERRQNNSRCSVVVVRSNGCNVWQEMEDASVHAVDSVTSYHFHYNNSDHDSDSI